MMTLRAHIICILRMVDDDIESPYKIVSDILDVSGIC